MESELGPEEGEFFKAETGIQDPDQLRNIVNEVHEEAYRVSAYLSASRSREWGSKRGIGIA